MDYGLSPLQVSVITALSAGASTLDAAAEAGIHRNTIFGWRRNNIAFQHALAHAHYDRALAAREKAEELLDRATETIRAILEDPKAPAGVRLRTALAILQIAITPPEPKKQVMLEIEKIKTLTNTEPAPPPAPQAIAPAPAVAPQPVNVQKTHKPAQQPQIRTAPAIGRNQLCPCGSQLKYKKCCLNKLAPISIPEPIARPVAA